MWEDAFTGVPKFRARWLVQASDLPAATLPPCTASHQAYTHDRTATGSTTSSTKHRHDAGEVFLTNRVKDIVVRSIVKPITLFVNSTSAIAISSEGKVNMGPRLTHQYCDVSGAFHPLEGTDPILKRARVRQANAVALASRVYRQNEAAKSGKKIVESSGWLLPYWGSFQQGGRRDSAREIGIAASSSNNKEGAPCPPSINSETSDDRGIEEPPSSEDGKLKEGEQDKNGDATDSGSRKDSTPILSVDEVFTPRESAGQRKSTGSAASASATGFDMEVENSPTATIEDSSRARVDESLIVSVEGCYDADVEDSFGARVGDSSESQLEDCSEAKGFPRPFTCATTFKDCRYMSFNQRRGTPPSHSRRLTTPSAAEETLISRCTETPLLVNAKSSVAVQAARPVRARMSMGLNPKSPPAPPHSSSTEDVGEACPQHSTAGKRKRTSAPITTQRSTQSDYSLLRTPLGNDYQTSIPDLLLAEERKQPPTGTGAKLVGVDPWRSSFLCTFLKILGNVPANC